MAMTARGCKKRQLKKNRKQLKSLIKILMKMPNMKVTKAINKASKRLVKKLHKIQTREIKKNQEAYVDKKRMCRSNEQVTYPLASNKEASGGDTTRDADQGPCHAGTTITKKYRLKKCRIILLEKIKTLMEMPYMEETKGIKKHIKRLVKEMYNIQMDVIKKEKKRAGSRRNARKNVTGGYCYCGCIGKDCCDCFNLNCAGGCGEEGGNNCGCSPLIVHDPCSDPICFQQTPGTSTSSATL